MIGGYIVVLMFFLGIFIGLSGVTKSKRTHTVRPKKISRRNIVLEDIPADTPSNFTEGMIKDAVAILKSIGYSATDAKKYVNLALQDNPTSTEDLVRKAFSRVEI